ncbi:Peptidoglycan-binding (PGRP) domain of peptidoglycan hydrolases-containing protein [Stigmatella aurantiaca]|uniref:Peptidoglycan-binding (PGRP) domain of peptidoglycan hydrolases-containing protein n=1 Tax=Stigmatella aurantiaca TaxID=41 RepID=A0A1H7HSY9_STIAU|nr:peptidoglycan-binding protein [Stigmatella aurantiaca]SEK53466.1 Peptidoglycan-binding (PGRP) domain of peptidoglycan hydrolases-containing protein [Stigmatella aurantiaca]
MSTKHKVKQGDWLAKIARQHGFTRGQEIWDHPDNAALRQKRRNPYCLQSGDEVVIPETPGLKVSVGSSYLLQGGDPPDRFQLGLRRGNMPLGRRRYELKFGDTVYTGFLSFSGMMDHPLLPNASEGALKVWTSEEPELVCEWKLQLGFLDPLEEISGVQGRLLNLGYYSGPINNELTEDTRVAVANFQTAWALPPTGELDDETIAILEDRHDQNGGTELILPPSALDDDGNEPPASDTAEHAQAQQGGGAQSTGASNGGAQQNNLPQRSGTPDQIHRYGCLQLRRGDRDDQHRWGGAVQTVVEGNNGTPAPVAAGGSRAGNALTAPAHVLRLQRDLRELGFLISGTPDGVFALSTEWAVREFQIYSKMEIVAKENTAIAGTTPDYVARLAQVRATQRYTGPIHGVVDDSTERCIRHWLTYRLRCPVVVRAMRMENGNPTTVIQDNLWRHNDIPQEGVSIFVRDFSRYYTMSAGRNADALHALGKYEAWGSFGGPVSEPTAHTWATSEMLPSNLVGVATFQAMTASQQSTYKVVRACAEQECYGFFDSLNAYDNAFISLGPCHWTLGIVNGQVEPSEGELCGFLAYLRASNAQAFRQAIEFFGMRIAEDWNSGTGNGATLFNNVLKNYTGWPAQQRFFTAAWERMERTEAAGNYFKTYHWFYRLQMAGRTIAGFQRAMWNATRIRLRDIRDTPWGRGVANVGSGNRARPPTISDVVTSERGMALLLRWHIFRPSHITARISAGDRLRNAFIAARAANPTLNWTLAPNLWGDQHEEALVAAIQTEGATVNETINAMAAWPNWMGPRALNPRGYTLVLPAGTNLRVTRNSFQFDAP